MIIYLQTYMDTGKVEMNETSLKRSTPMTFGETMSTMFKLSKQVPWWFILAILPTSLFTVIKVAFKPMTMQMFLNGLEMKDIGMATRGFIFYNIISGVLPVMTFTSNSLGMLKFYIF